jgi:hypothetical protein
MTRVRRGFTPRQAGLKGPPYGVSEGYLANTYTAPDSSTELSA